VGTGLGIGQSVVVVLQLIAARGSKRLELMRAKLICP
jgi:hypothetical protein